MIYQTGFFRVRNLQLEVELVPLDFHVPYWVEFSGPLDNLKLMVIDAVRHRFEGAKVRNFLRGWLRGDGATAPNE